MGTVNPRILDEAAQWLARWHASDFSEAEHAALARWRSQSATHEDIWQRAQQLRTQMAAVPGAIGMAVLDRPRSASRRRVLRAAALALSTPLLGWWAYRHLPWQVWRADVRTAVGETRSLTLVDDSRVVLNTASAISVNFDQHARRIDQHAGEILVETAHGVADDAPPFMVQTEDGLMQALGTEFIVRKYEHSTTLSVLQGAVRITPAQTEQSIVVHAGEQTRFDAQRIGAVTPLSAHADAWTRGVLYAENMRLADLLAELGRYRAGIIRCDPEVADLRVSGTYQLADTDRLLQFLTRTLAVRIQRRTRYWITVVPA